MTTMLGQQQLMEPEPARRLIVARGAGVAHYGVDPSVRRVAVACAETRAVATQPFAEFEDDPVQRLDEIYLQTCALVDRIAHWPLPGLVWVEQPSGQHQAPQLLYAVGVIQAALLQAMSRWCMSPVRVETISSASWKKVATGFGRWDKPTRKKLGRSPTFEDYGVGRWARQNGYAGSSWDEADALGIAEACRRTVRLEER